jgi:glycosyltransferase involved in cell wall biosynthesis
MNIIFHYPLPLDPRSRSASGIRPLKMLTAFKELGYTVDLATGYSSERKYRIAQIKANVLMGTKYDFVYSESSTMPTILSDPRHLPLRPTLELSFFRFCNARDIPIGLFYRDIYWLFEGYGKNTDYFRRISAVLAYRYDLLIYARTLRRLFLPSLAMAPHVPWVNPSIIRALPPGHNIQPGHLRKEHTGTKVLKLFYVGGISSHYQMHELFTAISDLHGVELTVCTRSDEWLAVRHEYLWNLPQVRIIHEIGSAMQQHLASSDIALLFVRPNEYREFASPVKMYEYLGFSKPIIASQGTLVASFVEENKVGWSIPYEAASLKALLNKLLHSSSEIDETRMRTSKVSALHTWEARARHVVNELKE